MAHKKGGGSTRNGRDSNAKRLGVKRYDTEPGQCGVHHRPAARNEDPPGQQRWAGQGPHHLRADSRNGQVRVRPPRPEARQRLSKSREIHNRMKPNIHPEYYPEAQVICSCGKTYTTGSTKPTLRVELCNQCHPFFTGEQRIVDTEGRVERLKRRFKLE